jgi:hypothetical protein
VKTTKQKSAVPVPDMSDGELMARITLSLSPNVERFLGCFEDAGVFEDWRAGNRCEIIAELDRRSDARESVK